MRDFSKMCVRIYTYAHMSKKNLLFFNESTTSQSRANYEPTTRDKHPEQHKSIQQHMNMKNKQLKSIALVLLCTMLNINFAWGADYSTTISTNNVGDLLSGDYASASEYWKVPETAGNSATISIPSSYFTDQPSSNVTITLQLATFGSGSNPSSSNTTISAVGAETGSNWTGANVSTYPSSSTYVNAVLTISKPTSPTTLSGINITISVNSDVKIFRLQTIKIEYTYSDGGCTSITPTLTYTSTNLTVDDVTAVPTLNKDGSTGDVTYSSNNTSVATVASDGKVTAKAAGSATITATIAANEGKCEGTATANFTITGGGGDPCDAPLTVAEGYDATPSTDQCVRGIVYHVDDVNLTYHNATYWISDDGTSTGKVLEVYRGKYINNTDFTSSDQIQVGDIVVVRGDLTTYSSTREFSAGNYLISLDRPTPDPKTVTFNAGSGSCATSSLTEPSAGDGVTLPSASHACEGWEFAGWATAASGETTTAPTLYAASSNYTPATDITLYAVYKHTETTGDSPKEYTFTIDKESFTTSYGAAVEDVEATASDLSTFTVSFANTDVMKNATNGIQFKKNSGDLYNTIDLGSITSISISQEGSALAYVIGTSEDPSEGDGGGFFSVYNTSSNAAYAASITVVFEASNSTTTITYNSNPICGPTIQAGEVERLTSTKDQTVKSQAITVKGSNLAGSTLTANITGPNAALFSCSLAANTITAGAINTTYTISYTPTAFGDAQHTATLTFSDGTTTSDAITLRGRSLPEHFAIVAYDGANYYALDGSMTGTAKQATPLPVEVSAGAVVSCPTRAIYYLTERETPDQNVYLVGPAGRLWGSMSSTDLNTKSGSSTDQTGWLLTTSDFGNYHITNADATNRGLFYYKTSHFIGHYAVTNYGKANYYGDLQILPISNTCVCLDAPAVSVAQKASTATLTITPVVGATSYTITCPGATIAISGTTVTFTNLTPSTTYNYTVKAVASGTDCSLVRSGSFTTAACDEVPLLEGVTTTPSSATITWAGEGSATIRLYSDAAATSQVGSDYSDKTSPATIEGLDENTEYYYKIFASESCVSAIGHFTTDARDLEVVEWQKDAVVISFNDAANANLFIGNEVAHGSKTGNVADGLFFSKYFEANAQNKMLGIYNGTLDTLPLAGMTIRKAGSGVLDISSFGNKKTGWIAPGEEIIIVAYDKQGGDYTTNSAKTCAIEKGMGYQEWYETNNGTMTFSGPESVGLFIGDSLIDVIGSRHEDDYTLNIMPPKKTTCSYARISGENDANGYQGVGDNVRTKDVVETDYHLSTNRCLLVRKNSVVSGRHAVLTNIYDGSVNECSEEMAYSFQTLGEEWSGFRIGSGGAGTQEIQDSTCTGLAYLGYFDYSDYYTSFDTIKQTQTFEQMSNGDGTYTIPVPQLDTMACTKVRIQLYDNEQHLIVGKDYKVPIMIDKATATTADDEYFHSYAKKGSDASEVCKDCDVVILNGGVLTKASSDNAKDVDTIRNLTIYPGGKLIVPSGAKYEYTVNSIQFRVKNETAPVAKLQGNLMSRDEKVIVSKRINNARYYFFSLPFDCNIADIRWSNGDTPTRGSDYQIVEYDAERRAAEGSTAGAPGHWKPAGDVIKAGVGYNIAISSENPKELVFPMALGGMNLTNIENTKTTNKVTLTQHTGPSSINNHNWNLIAHPYVSPFDAYNDAKIKAGWLECLSPKTNDAEAVWQYTDNTHVYLTMPSYDADKITYEQTISSDITSLNPFLAVFVQVAGPGELTFAQGNRQLTAPARYLAAKAENEDESIFVGVNLSGNDQTDRTSVRIRPDFTNDYQLGYDLQKFTTYYTTKPQIYMKPADLQLAFQAVSDSVAKTTWMPMGVYCYHAGTYTFSLNENYPIDEVEAVYLQDKTTGITTNLLYDSYTITTTKQLYSNARFSLQVIVNRKAPEIATDIPNISNDSEGVIRKLLINGHVYIQRGAELYDITGKQLR